MEDGVEIAKNNHRTTLYPNATSASLAEQPTDVQTIANALWTNTVKTNFKDTIEKESLT